MVASPERTTWVTVFNRIPVDQTTQANQYKNTILDLKEFVVGNLGGATGAWSVVGSSNGVTADASDNWLTTADIINDTSGNAHSWIIFQDPDNKIQMVFSCEFSDTEKMAVEFATVIDPFSLGTTTASPSLPGTGYAFSSFNQTLENTPTLSDHRLHMWRSDVGDLILGTSKDGTGTIESVIWYLKSIGFTPGDAYPYGVAQYRAAAPDGGFSEQLQSAMKGWWDDGSDLNNMFQLNRLKAANTGSDIFSAMDTLGDDLMSNEYPREAVQVSANDIGKTAYRGHLADISWAHENAPALTKDNTTDSIREIVIGDFIMPFNNGDADPVI